MEVTELEVIPVAHRTPPLRTSWGSYPETAARAIVRLTTADGEVGVGETHGSRAVIDWLENAATLVEGMDPYERTPLKLHLQHAGAYGGIEMALLDIVGKSVGAPVCELLGGRLRDEVEYSAYLFYKSTDLDSEEPSVVPGAVDSPETMVAEAREFVDRFGFETLKLKGGVLPPDEEVATLCALAEEFGSTVPLRVDPNGNWSVETAARVAADEIAASTCSSSRTRVRRYTLTPASNASRTTPSRPTCSSRRSRRSHPR
jgi:glucarate dehydratase